MLVFSSLLKWADTQSVNNLFQQKCETEWHFRVSGFFAKRLLLINHLI